MEYKHRDVRVSTSVGDLASDCPQSEKDLCREENNVESESGLGLYQTMPSASGLCTWFTLLVRYCFTFYRYHQPLIGLSGTESIRLETSVLGPVPDPFYSFPLDLTAILSLTVSGIPRL